MANPIEPEVVEPVPEEKAPRKRRVQVRYKIRDLPAEVRRELDGRFAAQNHGTFEELARWLKTEHGRDISPSSLHNYYRNNFDPILRAVKTATAQAADILRVTGGDDDAMSGALFRLVQTAIFDLLVQLHKTRELIARMPAEKHRSHAILQTRSDPAGEDAESQLEDEAHPLSVPQSIFPSKLDLAAVSALGKTTAIVSKAIIEAQRWREEMRDRLNQKLAAATIKVSQVAQDGGMSPEVEQTIRSMLMEIKL